MIGSDPRLDEARAIPIAELAERFGATGLTRATATELVGPCPQCGGHEKRGADRFSINTARDVFNCRRCRRGGDGVALVGFILGCGFKEALEAICGARDHSLDPAEVARRRAVSAKREAAREAEAEKYRRNAIKAAKRIWQGTAPGAGTLAEAYMRLRGITFPEWPPSLRFNPDLPYWRKIEGEGREWHRGPAMVAAITAPSGVLVAVHMTWIDLAQPKGKAVIAGPEGVIQPAKLMRGSKRGGVIRLTGWREGATLIMGEGIETTATAMIALDDPGAMFWAGADIGNMAGKMLKGPARGVLSGLPDLSDHGAFIPPPWVTRLILLEDGDSDPTKTRAQLLSAARRAQAAIPGISAAIVPAGPGRDFNDILSGSDSDTAQTTGEANLDE